MMKSAQCYADTTTYVAAIYTSFQMAVHSGCRCVWSMVGSDVWHPAEMVSRESSLADRRSEDTFSSIRGKQNYKVGG